MLYNRKTVGAVPHCLYRELTLELHPKFPSSYLGRSTKVSERLNYMYPEDSCQRQQVSDSLIY